jgi:ubiquinone/menaquinone biosynthesis C-methylase UbiE
LSGLPIELTAIDPSIGMLGKARVRAAVAELVCASAENIPFPLSSFDLIVCVNAFHQFSNPMKFLGGGRALLRNAGRPAIFGLDPHANDYRLVRTITLRVFERRTWHDVYQPREIERRMVEAGFGTVLTETAEHIEKSF